MLPENDEVRIQLTRPEHFETIGRISRAVYPNDAPWSPGHLESHLAVFPEGQFVAAEKASGHVVGMAASLIVTWDDYDRLDSYNDFTDAGYFRNHDPAGRTLYGAEVMVDPSHRRRGIGSLLYDARENLARSKQLLRIRAGARLPGFGAHSAEMDVETYVRRVVRGTLDDPTLSFQLHRGFHVLTVVPNYFQRDPKSLGYAVLIEWLNDLAHPPTEEARRHWRFEQDD